MNKYILFISFLISGMMSLHAEDIKVGNIKYTVTGANTVTLTDAKKAEGSFTIPEEIENKKGQKFTVTSIGKEAFKGSKITAISIPNTVTSLSEASFKGSMNLTDITLPESITEIPLKAFEKCESLKSFSIPGVKIIGKEAFKGCKSLNNIIIPGNVTQIDNRVFEHTKIKSIELEYSPETLLVTAYELIGYDPELTTLSIDRNWTSSAITTYAPNIIIGEHVTSFPEEINKWFKTYNNVQEISLDSSSWPNQIVMLYRALKEGERFKDVSILIPDIGKKSLKEAFNLGRNTLAEQRKLQQMVSNAEDGNVDAIISLINLYDNNNDYNEAVKYIKKLIDLNDENAYKDLSTTFSNSGHSDAYKAFKSCMLTGNTDLAFALFENAGFYGEEKEEILKYYPELQINDNGMIFNIKPGGAVLVKYQGYSKDVVIPSKIKDYNGHERSVTTIGRNSFADSEIVSVEIPASVITIGMDAFENCLNLTKVSIANSKDVNAENRAFIGCDKLTYANINWPYIKSKEFNEDFYNSMAFLVRVFTHNIAKTYLKNWINSHSAQQCFDVASEMKTGAAGAGQSSFNARTVKLDLLKKSVNAGNTKAQQMYCLTILEMIKFADYSYNKSFFQTAQALAAKGDALGYYYLGAAYEYGWGVGISRSKAHSNYAKARDKGIDCEDAWWRTI